MFGRIQHFNQNAHTCKAMNKTGIWSVVCNTTAYNILHLIGQCGLPQVIHKYILVNLVLIMSHAKLSIRITITFAVFLPVVLDRDGEKRATKLHTLTLNCWSVPTPPGYRATPFSQYDFLLLK